MNFQVLLLKTKCKSYDVKSLEGEICITSVFSHGLENKSNVFEVYAKKIIISYLPVLYLSTLIEYL